MPTIRSLVAISFPSSRGPARGRSPNPRAKPARGAIPAAFAFGRSLPHFGGGRSREGPAPSPLPEAGGSALGQPHREPAGDHTGVQADGAQASEEARVLDLAAAVHYHLEAALSGDPRALRADHPQLHPEDAGAGGDRLLGDRRDLSGRPEHVHDLYVVV